MAEVIDLSRSAAIEDEASTWIARVDRGLETEESEAFQIWLTTSREHYDVFMQMAEFWDLTEQFTSLPFETLQQQLQKTTKLPTKKPFVFQPAALAAGLVAVFGVFLFSILIKDTPEVLYFNALAANTAVLTETLPDGSTLTLNAGAAAEIAFTNQSRTITLKSGDAFLEVSPEPDRIFTVHANGRFFQALGTAFLVSIKPNNQIDMLVSEGEVAYGFEGNKHSKKPQVAKTGEKVTNKGETFSVKKIDETDLERYLGWRAGLLVFQAEPIKEVVRQISRYTDKKIIISSPEIAQELVTGRFEVEDITEFLQLLKENFDIGWREYEDTILLIDAAEG